MTENAQSNFENKIQPETINNSKGSIDDFSLIDALLRYRNSSKTSSEFTQSFFQYLINHPDIVLITLYKIDPKTRDIFLSTYEAKASSLDIPSEVRIPTRSSETLARVALTVQPFVSSDIETEPVDYKNGIFDPKTRSVFICPVQVSEQFDGILEIQSSRKFGVTKEDMPGLVAACQLFGNFLGSFLLDDESGLTHRNLVTYSSSVQDLLNSDPSRPLYETFIKSFYDTDFVVFIFKSFTDELLLEDLFDAKGTGFDASLKGLKVNPGILFKEFNGRTPLLYSDLSEKVDFGDLFSFFIRRECSSVVVIPILINEILDEVLVIGSREQINISLNDIKPFLKIIEVYEQRESFDVRLGAADFLQRDLRFLSSISSLVSKPIDKLAFLSNFTEEFRNTYQGFFDLVFVEFDQASKKLKSSMILSEKDLPVATEKILPNPDFENVISEIEPFYPNDADLSLDIIAPDIDQPQSSIVIPILMADQILRLLILQEKSNPEILRQINTATYLSIGKLFASFLSQFNIHSEMEELDQTISRIVTRQKSLNQITIQISGGRSLLEVISGIPKMLVDIGICQQAGIFSPNPDGYYQMRISEGYSEDLKNIVLSPGEKLAGKVLDSKKPELFDPTTGSAIKDLINPANLSGLAVLIAFEEGIFAVLEMEHAEQDQFSDNDLELLNIFALGVGSRLANLKLVEQVQSQVLRQEKLYEITNKLRRSLDMESIMKISTSEIAKIAAARKASIQLIIEEESLPEAEEEIPGGEE